MKKYVQKGLTIAIVYVVLKWTIIVLAGTYLYEKGLWNNWLLLIFPAIALTAYWVRKNNAKSHTRFRKFFVKAIETHFPDVASSMIDFLDQRFNVISGDTSFAQRSTNPMDKRLDFAACFLALIQTLEHHNQSYEQIRTTCLEVTYDYVSPKNALEKWLKKLPAKVIGTAIVRPLIKLLHNKISMKGNRDGFRAVIITDKRQTYGLGYGVDILECGICKLFQKHDAHKYASILCEVDKVTSNLAGLELIRNSTIAYGADKCDFRFRPKQMGKKN
jgi:hypothetical protein